MGLIVLRIHGSCDSTMGHHSNAVSNVEQLDTRRRISDFYSSLVRGRLSAAIG
jgi:hypothetical protein